MFLDAGNNNDIRGRINTGGTANVAAENVIVASPTFPHTSKLAMSYAAGDYMTADDGALVSMTAGSANPGGSKPRLRLGGHQATSSTMNGHIRRLTYWPRAISDASLASYTGTNPPTIDLDRPTRRWGGMTGRSLVESGKVPTTGVLSLPELLQKRYGDPVPAPDGLTAATAATSAAQILLDYPSSGDGIYYIQDGSSTKQVYCDMTNDGGGWMLYSSFASDNTLDATNYPAWNGNRLLYADVLGTNAATYGYASIGATITSYHDGTTNNFAGYTQQPQHLGVFASGSPVGGIGATTWNGPSTVSKLRIAWGRGSASYAGGNNTLEINGSQVDSIAGSVSKVASYSFNPAGSSAPYFGVKESSIVGISYVYMR